MYKINVYERDETNNMVLLEDSGKRFAYEREAKLFMLNNMIETLNLMIDVSHQQELYTNSFTLHQKATEEGKMYNGVIRRWNIPANIYGEAYYLYEIVWADESPVDKYNKMLKDTHGESLTLWIYESEFDCVRDDDAECDGNCDGCMYFKPQYYYEGATCGRSDTYDTAEEAYEEANDYMNNIDLYVD